jgi:hypothetical protein
MTTSGITLAQSQLIDKGAFSWVISDSEGSRVYKLFKRHTHPDYDSEDPFEDERNIGVFRSELDAYTIVQRNRQLIAHTPNFFGRVLVSAVVDTEGRDIAPYFLLDCCLCLQRVQGAAQKLNLLLEVHAQALETAHILERVATRKIEAFQCGQSLQTVHSAVQPLRSRLVSAARPFRASTSASTSQWLSLRLFRAVMLFRPSTFASAVQPLRSRFVSAARPFRPSTFVSAGQ